MVGFYFLCAMGINPLVTTPLLLVYRILTGVAYAVGIEIVNYQGLAEQASLFLKSEVAIRQS